MLKEESRLKNILALLQTQEAQKLLLSPKAALPGQED